jgi:hypothetical protein
VTPIAADLAGVNVSTVFIHAGSSGCPYSAWSSAPLPDREEQQQQAENDLDDAHPGRGGALLAGGRAARDQQHDRPQDGDPDDPPGEERRPVGTSLPRGEHQHHGDDRDWAERHTDAE